MTQQEQQEKKQTWTYPGQASTFFDPLLTSLVIITKMHGRSMGAEEKWPQ